MYIKERENGVSIRIRVTPKATKSTVAGIKEDCLLIRLAAPPVEGKANKELLNFIGKKLGVPISAISILHGHFSREKIVLVNGLDAESVRKRLEK